MLRPINRPRRGAGERTTFLRYSGAMTVVGFLQFLQPVLWRLPAGRPRGDGVGTMTVPHSFLCPWHGTAQRARTGGER